MEQEILEGEEVKVLVTVKDAAWPGARWAPMSARVPNVATRSLMISEAYPVCRSSVPSVVR